MSPLEIVNRYYEACRNGGDLSGIPLADDVTFSGPLGTVEGAANFRAHTARRGDMKCSVRDQFVNGNRVCSIVDWTMSGPCERWEPNHYGLPLAHKSLATCVGVKRHGAVGHAADVELGNSTARLLPKPESVDDSIALMGTEHSPRRAGGRTVLVPRGAPRCGFETLAPQRSSGAASGAAAAALPRCRPKRLFSD
jgi:hypothetical protein